MFRYRMLAVDVDGTLVNSRDELTLATREALSIVDQSGFATLLYGDTFAEGFDFYCRQNQVAQPALAEYLELNPDCERIWPALVTDPPQGIFAGFTMGTREEMLALNARLHERLPGKLFTNVLRSPRYRGYMCE